MYVPALIAFIKAFAVLIYGTHAHAHARKAAVVKKVLHGYLPGEVRKQGDTVIGAILGCRIAQRGHAFSEINKGINSLYPTSRSGDGGGL